jgi:hypothetical protein
MSPHQAISLNFKPVQKPTTQADFTYHITRNTISIIDTGKGSRSVTIDIEAVLGKIEFWHQGSITGFKIMYWDENGVWDGVGCEGQHRAKVERCNCGINLNHPSDPKDVFCSLFLG